MNEHAGRLFTVAQSLSGMAQTVLALGFVLWLPPTVFTRTVIFRNNLSTLFTLDCAAPVEFTVTATDHFDALLHHSQSTLIAQSAAAFSLPWGHPPAALQTLPALCALVSQGLVLDAVIWGILQVNELRLGNASKSLCQSTSVVCAVSNSRRLLVHLQLLGLLMLHFHVVTNFSEVSQLHPAGLDAAASRNAMAFTSLPHGGLNCLSSEK